MDGPGQLCCLRLSRDPGSFYLMALPFLGRIMGRLEVACITFAHIPPDRIQSHGGLFSRGAGKCSLAMCSGGKDRSGSHGQSLPHIQYMLFYSTTFLFSVFNLLLSFKK